MSVDLIQGRDFSSSVVLNDDLLWIIGIYYKKFKYFALIFQLILKNIWFFGKTGGIASTEKASSEFVSLTQPSRIGPDLPGQYSFAHCMTKVDEDLVILTGGSSNNGHHDGETLLVNPNPNDNFTMTPGPRLETSQVWLF